MDPALELTPLAPAIRQQGSPFAKFIAFDFLVHDAILRTTFGEYRTEKNGIYYR